MMMASAAQRYTTYALLAGQHLTNLVTRVALPYLLAFISKEQVHAHALFDRWRGCITMPMVEFDWCLGHTHAAVVDVLRCRRHRPDSPQLLQCC